MALAASARTPPALGPQEGLSGDEDAPDRVAGPVLQPVDRLGGLGRRETAADGRGQVEAAGGGRPDQLLDVLGCAARWGMLSGQLRGRSVLGLFHPRTPTRLHPIAEAVRPRRRSRCPVEVTRRAACGAERYGERDVDPVSDTPQAPPALMLPLRVLGEHPDTPAGDAAGQRRVSGPEARVLALAAAGDTTARIATSVGLTADGVSYHLARLAGRRGVRGRTALVARAYSLGRARRGHLAAGGGRAPGRRAPAAGG
ncbi:LuxR C-terminal-related transcriptional regulator [Streptomyces sp. NPDC015171]|uniref:helix-turn-helix transcriptional regulator n=1 Tax=Streptomyces sp. NPDC015171 TaxID=3364945 RepID=UPI0036F70A14